ncbi:MAG: RnfABCDGE type electron transport complex subunit D [Clostridia bacterium]|nr:RnfABCDGE type electron transport complex subunit D [Clostridia bacterium]
MKKLIMTVSPHFFSKTTTQRIMLDVIIALFPAVIASVINFGLRSLLVIGVCVAVCVLSEWIFEKICKKESTISDLSAVVTGILLAFNLPVSIPLWQAVVGCLVAIVIVKQLFGGIGQNFANPAIAARIVMLTAFSGSMTTWTFPDAVTGATPLALISKGELGSLPSYIDMFLGHHGGCLGETCILALLLGGIYLLFRRVISWHTPVAFIGTVAVMSLLCGYDVLYQLMGGGLVLGAFFMATDYATTPATKWGKIIFGVGCGLITVLIRFWGNFPEGVSFSILLMNILTPYISKLTRQKPLTGGCR